MDDKETLYSRQIAAYGSFSMNKLSKLKILIYGIRGLGIEIAKNIILAGPEKVSIFDNNKIIIEDLGSNFYVDENDIGSRRDEISIKKLEELNNYVKCDYIKDNNIEERIKEYDILVISEIMILDEIIRLNNLCHSNKKGFIYCLAFGLSFYCFVDFGEHLINNLNNADRRKFFIKNIKKGKNTTIFIDNEFENFDLNENDYVIFNGINGMSQLLDGKKRKIKNSEDDQFVIEEDSTNYEDYIQGGIVEEVVENRIINHKQFDEMKNLPEKCEIINPKNKEFNLHLAFLSLHEFYKINNKLPENNANDIASILNITKDIFKKYEEDWCNKMNIEEDYLIDIYKYAKNEISPLCGYGGGVVSQEIIKYIGIYYPINQWFRAEFISILDKEINHNTTIKGTRYDEQILIFGEETQKNLENLNIFMIGAGAVGCELLKYFAMMGISTNPKSLLTLTDHDRIERSNLNRQFLFRENDLGHLKSECAIKAIKLMNKKINCISKEEFVNDKTKEIFNKNFFEKQNAVIMAVDNFEARTYISEQCEKYKIPYFNCGTEGPYANVEAFIPGKIEKASYPTNYKKIVPPCTLKMFPSSINHCILWAIDQFEKYFYKNIINVQNMNNDINKFYEDMNKIIDLRVQYYKIKKIFKLLKIANTKDFGKCIKYSVNKFYNFYIYKINNILKLHPPDKISKNTGLKFWTGNKILPHSLVFDINEEYCFEFIKSFSLLLAYCLGIDIENINKNDYIKEYIKKMHIKPKKFKTFENKLYYEKKIKEIKEQINKYLDMKKDKIIFNPIKYEKDTSDINQINYIFYTSNLRAKNYNIEQLDKLKIKIIAGKIIPSLITSTSSIAGLLALQLYVICQNSNCKTFRVGIIDLSDNTLALGIPVLIKEKV